MSGSFFTCRQPACSALNSLAKLGPPDCVKQSQSVAKHTDQQPDCNISPEEPFTWHGPHLNHRDTPHPEVCITTADSIRSPAALSFQLPTLKQQPSLQFADVLCQLQQLRTCFHGAKKSCWPCKQSMMQTAGGKAVRTCVLSIMGRTSWGQTPCCIQTACTG